MKGLVEFNCDSEQSELSLDQELDIYNGVKVKVDVNEIDKDKRYFEESLTPQYNYDA